MPEVSNNVKVTLPDGTSREYPAGTTLGAIAKSFNPRLAKEAVVARVDGTLTDLGRPAPDGATLEFLTFADGDGQRTYRHSTAHVMAQAVQKLFPGVKFAIGPAIADGFYYDFDTGTTFTPEDLEKN